LFNQKQQSNTQKNLLPNTLDPSPHILFQLNLPQPNYFFYLTQPKNTNLPLNNSTYHLYFP
ncbi:DUF2508 family protein, partial [Bacillus altitudinis]|uniref:DUF2508 family protein n=1 Tax=Bacillus altitudinis TaxID=293387 RepID=UPI00119E70BB